METVLNTNTNNKALNILIDFLIYLISISISFFKILPNDKTPLVSPSSSLLLFISASNFNKSVS